MNIWNSDKGAATVFFFLSQMSKHAAAAASNIGELDLPKQANVTNKLWKLITTIACNTKPVCVKLESGVWASWPFVMFESFCVPFQNIHINVCKPFKKDIEQVAQKTCAAHRNGGTGWYENEESARFFFISFSKIKNKKKKKSNNVAQNVLENWISCNERRKREFVWVRRVRNKFAFHQHLDWIFALNALSLSLALCLGNYSRFTSTDNKCKWGYGYGHH